MIERLMMMVEHFVIIIILIEHLMIMAEYFMIIIILIKYFIMVVEHFVIIIFLVEYLMMVTEYSSRTLNDNYDCDQTIIMDIHCHGLKTLPKL